MSTSNFCDECGQHFAVHNDDGSCVWDGFTPVADATAPIVSLAGTLFFGVDLPDDIPFYDVRRHPMEATPRAPWGEALFGSAIIAEHLGLLTGYDPGQRNWCTPATIRWNHDSRDAASAEETVKHVRRLLELYRQVLRQYEDARGCDPADGGSVHYRPAFVALDNFGGCVAADKRDYAVRPLGSWK